MRSLFLIIILVLSESAHAEQSIDGSGDYFVDVGQVYGGLHSIRFFRDICADAFPALQPRNEKAYELWRNKYLKFLQEVESNWTAVAWQESGGDVAKYRETLTTMTKIFDQYKEALRQQLSSSGAEQFQRACFFTFNTWKGGASGP